jgi:hypothetical protein
MNIIASASPRDIDREFGTTSPGEGPRQRNCNVNLDDLDWDRPDMDCEPQHARGIPHHLQLDETTALNRKRDVLNMIHDGR